MVKKFVDKGVVEALGSMIKHISCLDVVENSIWAIANLITENVEYRDLSLKKNIHKEIISNCQSDDIGIREISYWALCNFCQGTPAVPLKIAQEIILVIKAGIRSDSSEILGNCA